MTELEDLREQLRQERQMRALAERDLLAAQQAVDTMTQRWLATCEKAKGKG